jgi:hypothetical protein
MRSGVTVVNHYTTGGGGGGGGGGSGISDHGSLLGLLDNDHPQYALSARLLIAGDGLNGGGALTGDVTFDVDSTVVRTSRQVIAGAGMTGGGTLAADRTFTIASANAGIVVNPTNLALTLATDSGLAIASGLRLGTPGTLTVSSLNERTGSVHTHAVDWLSTTGATTTLLGVTLGTFSIVSGTFSTKVRTPLIDAAAGLTIQPTGDLTLDPLGDDVKLRGWVGGATGASFSSTDYLAGFPLAGFRIGPTALAGQYGMNAGVAEFDELRARIFVADETRVDRGQLYVTKSYGILLLPFTVPASGGDTADIYFENSPHIVGALFSNNDWIMLRHLDMSSGIVLSSVWGQVSSYFAGADYQRWTFTLRYRGGLVGAITFPKSANAVNFGQSGQGYILIDAITSTSPFVQVGRWVGADPYTPANRTVFAQMGRLDGVGLTGEDGFWAGTGTTSAHSYFRAGAAGVELWNAPIRTYSSGVNTGLWNANGDFLIGFDGIGTIADRDFSVSTSGYVRIGREGASNPNVLWHEASGTLSLRVNTTPVITFDTTGASYFAGVMTIGTSGEIRQGTGTLGSNYTGLRIWRDGSMGRIAGYNNNVLQWGAGTDGVLYAGAGSVILDENGLAIERNAGGMARDNALSFVSSGVVVGSVAMYNQLATDHLLIEITGSTGIELISGGTGQIILLSAPTYVQVSNDLEVFGDALVAGTMGVTGAITTAIGGFGSGYGFTGGNTSIYGTASGFAIEQGGTDIWRSTTSNADSYIRLGYNNANNRNTILDFHSNGSAPTTLSARLIRAAGANGALQVINTGTGSLDINQSNLGIIRFNQNGVELARFHTDGRLGIGTTAPATALDVDGYSRGLVLFADGDGSGFAATNGMTGTSSSTISTGVGNIRTSGTTARTNTHWMKFFVGTTIVWVPAWTTITG